MLCTVSNVPLTFGMHIKLLVRIIIVKREVVTWSHRLYSGKGFKSQASLFLAEHAVGIDLIQFSGLRRSCSSINHCETRAREATARHKAPSSAYCPMAISA